jgi:hypothetical protein
LFEKKESLFSNPFAASSTEEKEEGEDVSLLYNK